MSEIFKIIFVYVVILYSISFCMEDSLQIYNNDKQSLFFERHNLSVVIHYNEYLDCLQFHFNWDASLIPTLEVTLKHIPSTNTSIHCVVDTEESINGPDYFLGGRDELNFGCTYFIIVNDSIEDVSFNYTIPYCVDGKCDCNHFPLPMNITVDYQQNDEFLIEWFFGNPEDEKTLENVTFISYVIENCGELSGSDYTLMEPKFRLLDSNNSALIYIEDNPHLCLLITFTNKYGCPERYLRRLEVTNEDNSTWLNISYTLILVILLLVIIALWYIDKCRGTIKAMLISRVVSRRRRNQNIYGYPTESTRIEENNVLYIEREILDGEVDAFELPRNHLKILYEIGKGAFGEVYLGNAFIKGKDESVAVKTLREKCSIEEMEDFRAEIDIMKKIGQHPNIVTMLKCCTLHEPYMMVMEYVPYGDLKNYLVNLRDKWKKKQINYTDDVYNGSGMYINPNSPRLSEKPKKPSTSTEYTSISVTPTPTSLDKFTFDIDQSGILDHNELQNFALQIACGMAHLEKIPITHRDLAARNILIDANKVLKISDFGLSRPGPYINKSHNKLPLRWMALEAIEDHIYDNKSDVWSFGIVLWEIGTLGAFPYDEVSDRMLIYYLHIGKRLQRPEICTDELYTLMLRCWSENPKLRPTFEELVQQLDVTKNRIYIDFTQLNPAYVFPPTSSNRRYIEKGQEYPKKNEKIQSTQDNAINDKEKYLECP